MPPDGREEPERQLENKSEERRSDVEQPFSRLPGGSPGMTSCMPRRACIPSPRAGERKDAGAGERSDEKNPLRPMTGVTGATSNQPLGR